ncbi:hypothetical protein A2572_03575 [Candidatus Collierbacteria bacterium RIFOXYD1_FULL_40_9]|uniref:Uncharacterized protein n=1 Tax=Candidatus Collierbacteria bacterium RIFOXYD1_FULL_40_9 TaxID=1817731 RepID=A0A1F5FUP8_9BACT|nr:MAG: hypothetical protein A2572_03575 [Candidatus Collierbacteria bacterium RIFOXYD1_FULL_40_9]
MTTKTFITLSLTAIAFITIYYGHLKYLKNHSTNTISVDVDQYSNTTSDDQLLSSVKYNLPEGDQTYAVSHGKNTTGPKMSQIIFEPLAFKNNEKQKIKIIFPEKEVVGSVVVFITTDNKENQKVTFTKDSKTNTWTGEWVTNDSVKSRYSAKIIAVGSSGEYNNIMYFL